MFIMPDGRAAGGGPRTEGDDMERMGVDVILEEVVRELRVAGVRVRAMRAAPGELALALGSCEETVMTIAVHDRARPSFLISYGNTRTVGVRQREVLNLARALERAASTKS